MPGFHKRREYKYEGTVESIYLMDDMTVEVVADGIHVPPTILRLGYYGPADTYNGAESRYTSGRRRTNGIRNTGTHYGCIRP